MKKLKLKSRYLFSCLAIFVFSTVLFLSCDTEDFQNLNDTEDIQNLNKENTPFRVGQGFGIQMINDNQTNDELVRGEGVAIPLFSGETVEVKTGTWVTLRYGFFGFFEGECPEDITSAILEEIYQYLDDNQVAIYFDGEEIDAKSWWRLEGLEISETEFPGFCTYRIPWRYYVNPQSKGDYEFNFVFLGVEYVRTISWDPKLNK